MPGFGRYMVNSGAMLSQAFVVVTPIFFRG